MAIMIGGQSSTYPAITRAGNPVYTPVYHTASGTNRNTKPGNYFFRAYDSSGTTAGFSYIIFDTIVYQIGSGYNSSTGLFTIPVTGRYCFEASMYISNAIVDGYAYIIGIRRTSDPVTSQSLIHTRTPASTNINLTVRALVNAVAGETYGVYWQGPTSGTVSSSLSYTWFSGYLIG